MRSTTGKKKITDLPVNNRENTGSFIKGKSANPGGRPRGAKGKFTNLKESFLNAYNEGGGDAWLITWAKENETDFFKILARLLPKEIEVETKLTPREQIEQMMKG